MAQEDTHMVIPLHISQRKFSASSRGISSIILKLITNNSDGFSLFVNSLYQSPNPLDIDGHTSLPRAIYPKSCKFVTIYIVSLDNLMETDSMCRYLNELGSLRQSQ